MTFVQIVFWPRIFTLTCGVFKFNVGKLSMYVMIDFFTVRVINLGSVHLFLFNLRSDLKVKLFF